MARGPKLHLKRLFAPKDWFLSKLTGIFAPRPRAGPHKLRESMPLLVILRNRLKYALNAREVQMILRQRFVAVDGRVRVDPKFPAGFMDVIKIARSNDRFRLLYDSKGRFTLIRIKDREAHIKICKVERVWTATGRVPVLTTTDGRRIRYPDPRLGRGDSFVLDTRRNKILRVMKMRPGRVAFITGGSNRGRVGEIMSLERHPGAFDIARLKDKNGNEFATRVRNVFVIGRNYKSIPITLPKGHGEKINPVVDREAKLLTAETRKASAATRRQQATRGGKKAGAKGAGKKGTKAKKAKATEGKPKGGKAAAAKKAPKAAGGAAKTAPKAAKAAAPKPKAK